MVKTRLHQLFIQLSKWDINHLEKFLNSPYFNKREDVIQLFYFLKQHPSKAAKENGKELAFQATYPDRPFSDKDVDLLFSYLFKLLEEFLALQAIKNDKALMKMYTAKSYKNLSMSPAFSRAIKDSRRILSKGNLRNSDYLRRMYDLENELYNYIGGATRTRENNLEELSQVFDVYYISEKIRHYCFQLSHQAVFKKEYQPVLMEEIIQLINEHPKYLEYPPIAIYFNYYKAIISEEEDFNFAEFRQKIEHFKSHFSTNEIRDIYLAAINICIRRVNKGGGQYILEIFELYKNGIEQGFLLENDELSPFIFLNMISASIKLKKLDFLEKFIKKYSSRINPAFRESNLKYGKSALYYEQKKYKKAMQLLATLESNDPLLMLSGKTIQLKMLYELDEIETLNALLESMRIYLQRAKNLGYHKIVYKNVIQITKGLVHLPPYKPNKIKSLQAKIEKMQPQSLRQWFLEQIEKKK